MLVLALESSTSSAKAMLYDSRRGVVDTITIAYPEQVSKLGMQATEAVFHTTLEAGRQVAAGKNIEAISVGGVWHSIVACDQHVRPVTPTYVWTYTEASGICSQIRSDPDRVRAIYNQTGCVPHVTYQPYTLLHLREEGLNLKDKIFFSQGGYTFFRLTGERIESCSMVSGMGFLDTHHKRFDQTMMDLAGVSEDQFSPLGSCHDAQPLNLESAKILGLTAGIPVVPAHSDGALNQVGNLAMQPGMMTLSVGTSAAIRLSVKHPIFSEPPATWCYLGVEDWLCGAATAGACNCVNWFKQIFLQDHWSFKELDRSLLDDAPTPVFLPFLFGERCPGWQDDRRAGFSSLDGRAGVGDLFRAVCEGVLFNVYQCYEALMRLEPQPEKIILSGGILNSPNWMQIGADLWGREMTVSHSEHASLLGGAYLAVLAAQGGKSLADLNDLDAKIQESQIIKPRPGQTEAYRQKYEKYLDCYQNNG